MMRKAEVSVIVPVHDAGKYLQALIASLSAQRFRDFEVIFVDDGSKDESPFLLDEACRKEDRFKVLHIQNSGKYAARSLGINHAEGKYIAFCDSDDFCEPAFLEKMAEAAERTDADITVCGFAREDADNGQIYSREMIHFEARAYEYPEIYDILPMVNSAIWNKLFRRELLKHAIHFERPSNIAEDMMFCTSLYPHVRRITFVPEVLYHYRVHADSAMSSLNEREMDLIRANMIRTKEYVLNVNSSREMREYLDNTAFVHFALSLLMREVEKGMPVEAAVKEARTYLEAEFPGYRSAGRTLRWNLAHRNVQLKVFLGRTVFCAGLMRPFLSAYAFMRKKLGKEIRW